MSKKTKKKLPKNFGQMRGETTKKKVLWECPLCGDIYTDDETATTCTWIHIFRKDKYFKALNLTI